MSEYAPAIIHSHLESEEVFLSEDLGRLLVHLGPLHQPLLDLALQLAKAASLPWGGEEREGRGGEGRGGYKQVSRQRFSSAVMHHSSEYMYIPDTSHYSLLQNHFLSLISKRVHGAHTCMQCIVAAFTQHI